MVEIGLKSSLRGLTWPEYNQIMLIVMEIRSRSERRINPEIILEKFKSLVSRVENFR